MKQIYKHVLILSLLFFSAHAFGQDYLFSEKDEVTAFIKEKKSQYAEEKPNDSTIFITFHNYDDLNNLRSSKYLTFRKIDNIFYCIVDQLVIGYESSQYLHNLEYLHHQDYKMTNDVNEYGFNIYQKILNTGEESITVYASVSKVDRDNDKSEDIIVCAYYLDPAQLKMKK